MIKVINLKNQVRYFKIFKVRDKKADINEINKDANDINKRIKRTRG